MRCVECETDPKTPAHYCECCGRKLSRQEKPTKTSWPATGSTSSNASVPPHHRTRSLGLTAAAVLAGATSFGVGSYWLSTQQSPTPSVEPQTAVATDVPESKRESASPAGVPVPTTTPTNGRQSTPAPAPPQAVTSAQPSPGAARTRVQPKAGRPPTPSKEIASVPAPSPASSATPPTVAEVPAPQPEAAAPLLLEPPAPPRGPFFAPTDVTESPRIATRVEPQLPEDFRNRPINEVVVVRLLVSQTGHPFRVSLLRRSKAGLLLDDAVITAVNQWTFSPARKKGEAVSCWYNLGVPVRSNE